MENNYLHYTEEDFAEDPPFREWIKRSSPRTDAFWEQWLDQHPEKAEVLANARKLVLAIEFDDRPLSEERVIRMWENIYENLDQVTPVPLTEPVREAPVRRLFPVWRWAAAVLLLIGLSAGAYWTIDSLGTRQYQTAYGESQTITLPDGSSVTLNANSRLKFQKDWQDNPTREVWLEGEAFFSVVKKKVLQAEGKTTPARFLVHTDDLTVEVLGTEFNVARREDNTEVVLKSGKVKLNLNDRPLTRQAVFMKPGEQVIYSETRKEWVKRIVNAENHSAWRNRKWVLEDTPLREVAQRLEATYGVKVQFADPLILYRKVTGIIPTSDLNTLLDALSLTLDLKVTRQGEKILISEQ